MANQDDSLILPSASIDLAYIDELCDDLQVILRSELQAGNSVKETWKGDWPRLDGLLYISLTKYFLRKYSIPTWIKYFQLDDPHFAGAEYWCERHRQSLFCACDPQIAKANMKN